MVESTAEPVEWREFLMQTPPCKEQVVSGSIKGQHPSRGYCLAEPTLKLYCEHDACKGYRLFSCTSGSHWVSEDGEYEFVTYVCRNCGTTTKTFALRVVSLSDDRVVFAKVGQWPPYGPPTPPRLQRLIQPDRDLFLKGRRAECQGLGIGAFAYYRRVIENQWSRLLLQIIKAAKKVGAPPEEIAILEEAKQQTQFKKAVDLAKDAIPQALRIDGHNPLSLVHAALSTGIHNYGDDDCLARARNIRVVLTELAERLGQVLKEQAELDEALSNILKNASHR